MYWTQILNCNPKLRVDIKGVLISINLHSFNVYTHDLIQHMYYTACTFTCVYCTFKCVQTILYIVLMYVQAVCTYVHRKWHAGLCMYMHTQTYIGTIIIIYLCKTVCQYTCSAWAVWGTLAEIYACFQIASGHALLSTLETFIYKII